MTELFDTRGVRDDDAHWQSFAERVAAGAVASGRGRPFASSTVLWAGASLAFAASLILMLASAPTPDDAALRIALAPADDVGRALALRDAPPKIGELVLGRTEEVSR